MESAEIGTPTVGHFSAGDIMHTAIGSRVCIFQEQDMKDSHGGRSKGIVSYQEYTTVQVERCLWDQIKPCAWQEGHPSAAPIRCMPNIYEGPAPGSGVHLRSLQAI